MLYTGSFKNKYEVQYDVEIQTDNVTEPVSIIFSGNPCTINSSSNKLFDPIKSRGCTIEIVSKDYYMDLYEPTSRGTQVRIIKHSDNSIIFKGYLTPVSYDQDFKYLNTIQLEAVDCISTCKDFKWTNTNSFEKLIDIVFSIVKESGYTGKLYVPKTYSQVNDSSINTNLLEEIEISSTNFLDDNDKHDPWNQYEVLQEIMQFVGWSLCPYGNDVYLIDYRAISSSQSYSYNEYNLSSSSPSSPSTVSLNNEVTLGMDIYAPGTPSFSIDDIYNRIEISDNLYEIDEISPDIFDDDYHISINEEQPNFGVNGTKWTSTQTSGWLWWRKSETTITGWDYQTICRINPSSGWTHRYYSHSNLTEIDNYNGKGYYDTSSQSQFTVGPINKYCNTLGCLLQHYAYRSETGNHLPASLDWEDYLTFFILDDTSILANSIDNLPRFELPVLEYRTSEDVFFKPNSGTSWITIKGDLFYQNNRGTNGKKDKDVFTVINEQAHYYATAPVSKAVEVSDKKYFGIYREYGNPLYGDGWPCWKMKLQIGNKYWNGTQWTGTPSTFYINYSNGPADRSEEFLPAFDWVSPVNNSDFKDKVGVDGYCIPIASDDNNAPVKGKLTLTIYTPSLIPSTMVNLVKSQYGIYNILFDGTFTNECVPWCIFCKDFELGYVYTDTTVWYKNHSKNINKDKVYIGYINDNYVNTFDRFEMKINTALKDNPISRSYATTGTEYLSTTYHLCGNESKEQEYNVIDMYLDHHSERRPIYQCNVHNLQPPYSKFQYSYLSGYNFMLDSYDYDLKTDNNRIKLNAY